MTDPFHEGYVAAREGRSVFSNPYDLNIDMDRNCDWHDGYIDALNDMHSERKRREYWADTRARFVEWLITLVLAVIIGSGIILVLSILQYLVGLL